MQKPGLIGGLRMVELVSEHAEVDHNIICQRLLRGLARRHLGNAHTDYHMTSQFHCYEITSQDKSGE